MATIPGKGTGLLFDEFDLTSYFDNVEVSFSADTETDTAFGDDYHTRVATLQEASAAGGGMYDTTSNTGSHPVLSTVLGSDAAGDGIVSVCVDGYDTAGNSALLIHSIATKYAPTIPVGGIVKFAADFSGRDDASGKGYVVHILTAVSGNETTSSIDTNETTSSGAICHLHATLNSRDGTADIQVQDSADDAAWAALATFTQIAASTKAAERVETTGTVDRYLRCVSTIGGSTGSITFAVTVARK